MRAPRDIVIATSAVLTAARGAVVARSSGSTGSSSTSTNAAVPQDQETAIVPQRSSAARLACWTTATNMTPLAAASVARVPTPSS